MKSYLKSELAAFAGVSNHTFSRWLKVLEDDLRVLGISKNTKLLPPIAVKLICEHFCIDVDDPM